MNLYRISAPSYEECPTEVVMHRELYSAQEIQWLWDRALATELAEQWAAEVALCADLNANPEAMREALPYEPSVSVGDAFDAAVRRMCDMDGFVAVRYAAEAGRGAWDHVLAVSDGRVLLDRFDGGDDRTYTLPKAK